MLSKRTCAGLFFGDPPLETDTNQPQIAGRFNVAAAAAAPAAAKSPRSFSLLSYRSVALAAAAVATFA